MNSFMSTHVVRSSKAQLRIGTALTLLAGGILLSAPALAQSAENEGGPALGEIVVTAQKREQSLDKVPAAVTAVTGETLVNQGTGTLAALSANVPTLHISYGGLSEQIFIRGIGSGSNAGFEQSVGLFQDGLALSVARQSRLAFLDTERIEVLKGPQSTLFGKSTIGGAINITSGQPKFDFGGQLVGMFDVDGDTRRSLEGYVTGPVSDKVAMRLAFKASTSEGAFYNTLTDHRAPRERSIAGRISILARPTETFEIFASLQGSKADSFGRNAQIGLTDRANALNSTVLSRLDLFISKVQALDPLEDFTGNRFRSSGLNPIPCDECGKDKGVIGTLRMSLDIGPAKIVSLTGYIDSSWSEQIDADASPLPITNTYLGQSSKQFSEELRIESDDDLPFSYIGGIFYQNLKISAKDQCSDFDLGVRNLATKIRSCANYDRDETTMGVFAQGTLKLTDSLRATVGGRYQESDRDIANSRYIATPGTTSTVPSTDPVVLATAASVLGARPFSVSRSAGEQRFTPSASVEFTPYEGGLFYVAYRTGFKQGGYDSGTGTFNEATYQYRPEKAESFEAGFKTRFLGRRGRFSLNAFTSTFRDLQLSSFNGVSFTVSNAGKARSRGVEGEVEFAVTDGVTIGGSLAYLDARYVSYANAGCFANQTLAQGCDAPGATTGKQDLTGHVLPYSPKWSGSAFISVRKPLTESIAVFADGRMTARTSQEFGPDGDPNRIAPGVATYDLRIGFGAADGRWELAAVGKNLTNEYIPSFGFNVPLTTGAYVVQLDQPRVISVQAKVRF
jgi:iron complex outermembrane receptor protein